MRLYIYAPNIILFSYGFPGAGGGLNGFRPRKFGIGIKTNNDYLKWQKHNNSRALRQLLKKEW